MVICIKFTNARTCLIKSYNLSKMDERTHEQMDKQRVATQIGHTCFFNGILIILCVKFHYDLT